MWESCGMEAGENRFDRDGSLGAQWKKQYMWDLVTQPRVAIGPQAPTVPDSSLLSFRHHAQRSAAAGFCYVNDVALAISELRRPPTDRGLKKLDRVLYLDMLDIHHGDGKFDLLELTDFYVSPLPSRVVAC